MKQDYYLHALVWMSAYYGRARSPEALIANTAYDKNGMTPGLFVTTAAQNNLRATQKKVTLTKFSDAFLPAIAIMKDYDCTIITKMADDKITTYNPVNNQETTTDKKDFESKYSGEAILIQPTRKMTLPTKQADWFYSLIRANKSIYMQVVLAAILINIFALTSPIFIMTVYDRVIPNNAIETGWVLAIGALTIFVFDFILKIIRASFIDLAGRKIDIIASSKIFDQLLDIRLKHKPASSGGFAAMLKDFDSVRDFYTSATLTALVDLPFILFFIGIIYWIGGPLSFVLIGIILAVFISALAVQYPLKKAVERAGLSSETKHMLLLESITGLEAIKAIQGQGRIRARYQDAVYQNAAEGQAARFWSSMGVHISGFFQFTASILIVLAGMYLIKDGGLTIGALIACVILSGRAIAPMGQIAGLMSRYYHANMALDRLNDFMCHDTERPANKNFLNRPDLSGTTAFNNVQFAYPNDDKRLVLDSVSFTIHTGEKVGIIGRVGSGKSTIARLMMGLYEPTGGTLLADNTDYRQLDPADLRRALAYVPQDISLFSGTIRDNITAGFPHAEESEILNAAQKAGVHDFASKHPMGYDAQVGERGSALSGGQQQAIVLARALLRTPKMLICDEPTNAMDVASEKRFAKTISDLTTTNKMGLVLITHRFSLLDIVDRLILIDNGKIAADGPRDKVLNNLKGAVDG